MNILQHFIIIFRCMPYIFKVCWSLNLWRNLHEYFSWNYIFNIYIYVCVCMYNSSWMVHITLMYSPGHSLHSACHSISRRYSQCPQKFLKSMRSSPLKQSFCYVQFFKLNSKIIRKFYLLSEVLPHPLTMTTIPARSPAVLRSLMGLM